ncbi:DNA-3-methyladenine glycosylase family protein [Brenneria tiliae]|uniref:DNA-3-methyladenine glycosylase family protein n=1 Tax=Brenneria tiliae TaxID=2914984 RepID=UPI002014C681|nr:DNA-3-methyladenine glycosylase [Brenneria tiliae]MCL2896342.1 DNA-3-methyladenine glycosylase [Brenneria tiliae]MCL2900890.1 DNA-3-methyladenine glycosylase [Brenneria tiliae]
MTFEQQWNFDRQAREHLGAINDRWADLIAQIGDCRHQTSPHREPYEALIRAVAYQQLTARAGDAMIARLLRLHQGAEQAFPSAAQIAGCSSETLRQCGFSARKAETLRAIAQGALSGTVPTLEQALTMDDETLIERLCALKGIGRWTVEMFLIYSLERADVMPLDDLGIKQGMRYVYRLRETPTRRALHELSHSCRPYRTVASWYLWRAPSLPAYQEFKATWRQKR